VAEVAPVSEPEPLVSVGIPTYNRPEGLRRTLNCITAQTYRNLEIIVSDNCSPSLEPARIAREFAGRDGRIVFHRQDPSLGMLGNFRFVLDRARGPLFMWAADDDEWAPRFIERCVGAFNERVVLAMTGIETLWRQTGKRRSNPMPRIDPRRGRLANLSAFLLRPTPGMFYGLHRREALTGLLDEAFFDYYDCYTILRVLMRGSAAVVDEPLYTAGIDGSEYELKSAQPVAWGSPVRVRPFFGRSALAVMASSLKAHEKLVAIGLLSAVSLRLALANEARALMRRMIRSRPAERASPGNPRP
jgi:glycosyltransferase involved in cell wall biosynthesis